MDSHFDPHVLRRFIQAYQRVQPLTIGELWAIAITLRIVLVENLRRLAEGIVIRRAARQEADALADRLLGVNSYKSESAGSVLKYFPDQGPLPTAFAVQLVKRLRDQDPKVMPALLWLDVRLKAQGTTADDIVHEEHQWQGATNVTIRNVIMSMRLMSAIDWAEMFESVSLVDTLLRTNSNFGAMDFATRDLYRHAIEELARGTIHSELEVARRTLEAAKRASILSADEDVTPGHSMDPGYYLIANGRRLFEKSLNFHVPVGEWLRRANAKIGIAGYLSVIAALVLVIVIAALHWGVGCGGNIWILCFLGLVALIPVWMV
jgi:cyclic beta-1,2-glucan synthetase